MYPLYKDIVLNEQQQQIVRDYIREVNFAIPGTTPQDYDVLPLARYIGWNFKSEDLEAFAVGLRCTKPGFEKHHTFIRMSRGQLLSIAEAPRLPVNEPVLANETLRMQRWRDSVTGPTRTGIDSYQQADGSVPGVDMDLTQLEDVLCDIEQFAQDNKTSQCEGQFDLAVDFGTLLAGRYPRLKYFQQKDRLKEDQISRLVAFEEKAMRLEETLVELKLPTLRQLQTPEKRPYRQHNS
ncbi:hypothetical protein [Arcanobacterium buesumense]|uniref:Uncharacterized protein n=1 Tax=Arcanobacterium buesumense TaxID=2722751 RepID=A0A6H2EN41_9ACTO|nr:hypothetical protein [Arcanobacterium buesumense]QJC22493.1 hypothetical protein HC352_08255 [Arcanobacterium buesumense]